MGVGRGDSMEPLLSSGDRILIDTSYRVPVPPGKEDRSSAWRA
jgi:signal peptidase I